MEKIVLDTNTLLQIIPSSSDFHHIWVKIMKGEISICISTEILLEYEEVLSQRIPSDLVSKIIYTIVNNPNTIRVSGYLRWGVILSDTDDNKFVDCAIAAGAKFLVSDDKHLRILKKRTPPLVVLKTLNEYHNYLIQKR